jgi:hypothetical protein
MTELEYLLAGVINPVFSYALMIFILFLFKDGASDL